jgi:hypothetical protein
MVVALTLGGCGGDDDAPATGDSPTPECPPAPEYGIPTEEALAILLPHRRNQVTSYRCPGDQRTWYETSGAFDFETETIEGEGHGPAGGTWESGIVDVECTDLGVVDVDCSGLDECTEVMLDE